MARPVSKLWWRSCIRKGWRGPHRRAGGQPVLNDPGPHLWSGLEGAIKLGRGADLVQFDPAARRTLAAAISITPATTRRSRGSSWPVPSYRCSTLGQPSATACSAAGVGRAASWTAAWYCDAVGVSHASGSDRRSPRARPRCDPDCACRAAGNSDHRPRWSFVGPVRRARRPSAEV